MILCILYPGLAYKMCNKKKISDEFKNVTFTQTKDISGFNDSFKECVALEIDFKTKNWFILHV